MLAESDLTMVFTISHTVTRIKEYFGSRTMLDGMFYLEIWKMKQSS